MIGRDLASAPSSWATSSARCSPACSSGSSASRSPPIVKIVFFDLFLFATGYKVGPQFFRGLEKNALSQAPLTVVALRHQPPPRRSRRELMGYDAGTAAGLMAGAFTESTIIGTAGDAITRLDLSAGREEARC